MAEAEKRKLTKKQKRRVARTRRWLEVKNKKPIAYPDEEDLERVEKQEGRNTPEGALYPRDPWRNEWEIPEDEDPNTDAAELAGRIMDEEGSVPYPSRKQQKPEEGSDPFTWKDGLLAGGVILGLAGIAWVADRLGLLDDDD